MKRPKMVLSLLVLLAVVVSGCAPAATPEVIKETVEVIKEVPVTVEVTREVPVTVEVTKAAEQEAPAGEAAAAVQEWELVNPEGTLAIEPIEIAPRIDSLEGKKVGLKWNGKPNGNLFLDRVAELLEEQVPNVEIIKFYEVEPSTVPQSSGVEDAKRKAEIIASYEPDIVIGSQCD